ncbi:MAG: hypothetical protein J6A15_07435 [Clostridia bacterium]|nr:hypothetical protein [Clostridia bacterium]
MKIEENKNLTQRVISEVSQIIDMLPERSINQIPADIRNFFKNNAKEIEKYPVIPNIDLDKQDLDENTYNYVLLLMKFVKSFTEYIELETKWNKLETIEERVKQLEDELASNFFNINNILADRELEKVEYVYEFEYYGRCFNEENKRKLMPFIALCRVFNIVHKNLLQDNDYEKALKNYEFLSNELKKNIRKTY